MSNKQTDLYLEDLARVEEDLRDAQESYDNAKQETQKAYDWENKMKLQVEEEQVRLQKLKDKEF